MTAAASDLLNEIAIGIYRETGDKAAQLIASNILAKSNAVIAALLETPEIINSIANGEDVTQEIAGAVGAVLGGYVGATAGAAAATTVAGLAVATTLPAIAAVGIVAVGATVGGYILSSVGEAFFERLFGLPTARVDWLETENTFNELYGDESSILTPIIAEIATAKSLGGVYAEKYGALVTVDRINCFLAGTIIYMAQTIN